MPELETVDLLGVEILSIGGPIFGKGSPPGGDFFTTDDLRAMADAAQELEAAGEWRVAAKINGEPLGRNKVGHDPDQTLLAAEPTEGEMPAAGWLTNQRVSDDGKKLLTDITDVPKKLADLIEVKAYRTRSSEMGSITSQITGKTYDWVVTGLAWLGGKMPAVRTLDDIVALYESAGLDNPGSTRLVVYADASEGDVIWDAEDGFQDLMSDLTAALNPGPGSNDYWVCDVSTDRTKAIVEDYNGDKTWIVPFTVDENGEPTVAPSSDWTAAEMAWVKASKAYEQGRLTVLKARADIRPSMAEKTYSDEQRKAFATATGLDETAVTDEMLTAAGVPVEAPEPVVDPARELETAEQIRTFETRLNEETEARRTLEAELKTERKNSFVETVLRDGKAQPGQKAQIEKMYDADPELAREFYEAAPVIDDWAREYGADDGDPTETEAADARKLEDAYLARTLAIPVEELV